MWLAVFLLLSRTASGQNLTKAALEKLQESRDKAFEERQTRIKKAGISSTVTLAKTNTVHHGVLVTDITPDGQPVYRITLNVEAAQTTGASQLHGSGLSGLNLSGENMTIAVWDNGLVKRHLELDERLIATEGEIPQEHATHVTGTLVAKGINPLAKGMAPGAKAMTYYFNNDDAIMTALATPDQSGLLFSNHSYGTATGWYSSPGGLIWTGNIAISSDEDYRFGFYGEQATVLDELTFLAPYYSIFWAAGNDRAEPTDGTRPRDCNAGTGYDCIIPDAVAKNIFTIGAVNKVTDYTAPGSVVMSSYSSWGPTDDGRVKPDLVAAGTDLFSLSASGENSYTTLGGTSMATPNAAGSLLLVQELYGKLHGGQFMKSASLKALAIHTAKEAGPFPGPDYSFGWGLLDVAAAADLLVKDNEVNYRMEERQLLNGETLEWTLHPEAGKKITATIAWTDPAGTAVQAQLDPLNPMLVNDLDLRLVDDQGAEHKPWILDPLNPSRQAFYGDNFRDNVEKLEVPLPENRPYKLIVSHKGELRNGKQDFSLVVSYSNASAPRTLYWVGDSGDWADGTHWSLTTGGTPANLVPTGADRIVFDENSFDDVAPNVVSLAKSEEISRFRWLCSRPASIDLAGHMLTINRELTLSTNHSVITDGTINFSSLEGGRVSWSAKAFQDVVVQFESGQWIWRGGAWLKELKIVGGELAARQQTFALQGLTMLGSAPKTVDLSDSKVEMNGTSLIDSDELVLESKGAVLRAQQDAVLNWSGVHWQGSIRAEGGELVLNGQNRIQRMEIFAAALLNGNNEIDTLHLVAGGRMKIGAGKTQRVLHSILNGSPLNHAVLQGEELSAIEFLKREKLCFDFLEITSVKATGIAVVNAGKNSLLQDSPAWLSQDCEDVLYADFTVDFPCLNGQAELKSVSQGSVESHQWTITPPVGNVLSTDGPQSQILLTEEDAYLVQLEVTSGSSIDKVTRMITPRANTGAPNRVVEQGNGLMSVALADRYQWYKDEVLIAGATNRVYNFNGDEGVYFVVSFSDDCSLISEAFVVTGLQEVQENAIQLTPNPASHLVTWVSPDRVNEIVLFSLEGQVMYRNKDFNATELLIDELPEGMYVVAMQVGNSWIHRKLLVKRP